MINFTPPTFEYCRAQAARQTELARAIVPALNVVYKPKSIIEFGCGCGAFLKIFADTARTDDYMGVDGFKYPDMNHEFKKHYFMIHLTDKIDSKIKFDFAISLEVAEHIEERQSGRFINNLVSVSRKVILFSAATPGQGGDGHVNEQPHKYWHDKFKARGFTVRDNIRSIIAKNKKIPFWYRNNIFVYER